MSVAQAKLLHQQCIATQPSANLLGDGRLMRAVTTTDGCELVLQPVQVSAS